ncbi:hypothetical protein [Massilia sp. WF1]|uniref:hypothetical protein n=1 Tax=Massilia sp. WF1 TaxID=1406431 RepID=UPI0012E165ED|nr:hypothetical protein [Massilia sp. WF1]
MRLSAALSLTIYLNPHSPRYNRAKESKFLAQNAAIDPVVEETNGQAYMPDPDVSVKNSNGIMDNLRDKYNKKLMQQFDFFAPEIAIRVDK